MSDGAGHPLDHRPMTAPQIVAIAVCVLLNALDGFDVLAISFAAPGIAGEWGIDRAALGVVLSMELIGMAAGSILIGAAADRVGRRPTILACVIVMAIGMAIAPLARGVPMLLAVRFATGIGIGGMLACTNAMVAELSNLAKRPLAVAIMAAGYPLGAVIGGSIASALLATQSWHSVFVLGAVLTLICLPLAWLLLPESIGFLIERGRGDRLGAINAVLVRLRQPPIAVVPPSTPRRVPIAELFAPGLARVTTILTIAYFAHLMTFYFMLKWIPKIVVDMGYSPASAGGVLVWANVGGLSGGVAFSLLTLRWPVKALLIGGFALSFLFVTAFGQGWRDLHALSAVAGIAGFFTNACMVGLYALLAQSFPSRIRGGGTGFAIGIGRGGAALGPILAGALFASGSGLPVVATTMAAGSLLALAAMLLLRAPPPTPIRRDA